MEIKVLGTGCAKCKKLEANTIEAVNELGLVIEVEKVTEFKDILSYGIMSMPGLVINGEVKVTGRVPKVKELVKILSKA